MSVREARRQPLSVAISAVRSAARSRHRSPWTLHLSCLWLTLVFLVALAPGLFSPVDPILAVPDDKLLPPSLEHWLGTDQIGRDVFSRVVHGAPRSVFSALLAVGIGFVGGSLLGLLAGFAGGWLDDLLMRAVDVILAIPSILLSLTIVAALGPGAANVAVAVGVGSIAGFARIVRSSVISVRGRPYVEASFGSGASGPRVALSHVLPNSWGPALSLAALDFGGAILAVSALSFLGFGAEPPAPEWGSLISNGRNYVATAWWLSALPGVVVLLVVLASNRVGHAIRGRS